MLTTERLCDILRDAAKTEIVPRFRRLDEGMVRTKTSAIDLVTEADEGAERVITAALRAEESGLMVVGEEAVAGDPSLLDAALGAENVVYVDPVDGTANFAAGLPLFAVMGALVRGGETVAGAIYDPMGDDVIVAEKGAGAYQVFPDGRRVRLKFAAPTELSQMVGTVSVNYLPPERRGAVLANLARVSAFAAYRCAGHEYRTAATGWLHFVMYQKLMPWDHLAGALILAEAGAHVARLDGSEYRPHHRDGGILAAPDAEGWEALRREVFAG